MSQIKPSVFFSGSVFRRLALVAGSVGVLVGGAWLAVGWHYQRGTPTPRVDHAVALHALAPQVARADRALPHIASTLDAIDAEVIDLALLHWADHWPARAAGVEPDLLETASAWLSDEQHRALLGRLGRTLAERPVAGFDPRPGNPGVPLLDDPRWDAFFGQLWHAARMLRVSAFAAVDQRDPGKPGDSGMAAEAIEGIATLADMAVEVPTMRGYALRGTLLAILSDTTQRVLGEGGFDGQALERLARRLDRLDDDAALARALSGERLVQADLVQHAFTDNGRGGGRVTPAATRLLRSASASDVLRGLKPGVDRAGRPRAHRTPPRWQQWIAGPLVLAFSPDRAEVLERSRAALAATAALALETPGSAAFAEAQRQRDEQLRRERASGLGQLRWRLDPAVNAAIGRIDDPRATDPRQAQWLATRVALAAERFRLARGHFPATVAELRAAGLTDIADRGPAGAFELTVRGAGESARLVVYAYRAPGENAASGRL